MTPHHTRAAAVSPRWEDERAVAGFMSGAPNAQLLDYARSIAAGIPAPRCLDIGCGAARNALPLAELGFHVCGTDWSLPMLVGARARAAESPAAARLEFAHAPMTQLPFPSRSFDLVVAHGIWNLARSGDEFRQAVAEAARVAKPGAGLFVFTFSRHTLPDAATPDPGETFVFSSWNGEPQCFLTDAELCDELSRAGFTRASDAPLTEYNRRSPDALSLGGPPVIFEGTFTRTP